jgi:hypothetical protein
MTTRPNSRSALNRDHHFALDPDLRHVPHPDTLFCRCEDVPHAVLAQFGGGNEAKMSSRCGMGACQGRVCGAAAEFYFGWAQPEPRVPLSPARVATLARPFGPPATRSPSSRQNLPAS